MQINVHWFIKQKVHVQSIKATDLRLRIPQMQTEELNVDLHKLGNQQPSMIISIPLQKCHPIIK